MALILHLDDEACLLELVGELLRNDGHEVMSVTNSFEALHLLRSEPIDLFIQDLCRPDLDGKALYKMLKADAKLEGIPVIIASGNQTIWPTVETKLKKSGDEFMHKPFQFDRFLEVVNRMLAR